MLTETLLRQVMPHLPPAKAAAFLPHLNRAMAEYRIDTLPRAAAFLAQLAHESGEFRWMEEIWGPTPAQRRYEPLTDLSRKLGNIQSGDGKRFKGRGPIQLTGRANYQRFGQLLGMDLVSQPEQAATPTVGFRTAALYWANRGLNQLADAWNFREITRRINGGYNGLPDRQKYFERAKAALATAFQVIPGTTAAGRAAAPAREVPIEPLTRGYEAIRRLSAPKKRAKKSPAKKTATRKAPTRKTTTKKAGAKRAPPTRTPRKKASAVKKRATRKAPGKRRASTRRTKQA
jgi:putative chitinase